ncbi:hypothetical protein Hanom_Chr12g01103841 [Helianthus anomalus]
MPCTYIYKIIKLIKSKLQKLFFMFIPNFKDCPFSLRYMGFILYVYKSCTLHPLTLTKLSFCTFL